ncbi:MAG: regulatory protein GemA, partial [Anaerovoracaceae bacterium]
MKPICNRQKAAIWASAKEYGIDRQGVYDIIFAVSGQEHMTALTSEEAAAVLRRIKGRPESRKNNKRTDEGGNPNTVTLRRKIYMLTEQLGWNNN